MNQTGPPTQKVQARFGCAINPALFNASSFVVKASGASTFIPCVFSFSADSKTLVCEHSATPFAAGTTYQGILGEIDCQDGAKTQSFTWSWITSP
jgi:hypothetical protein